MPTVRLFVVSYDYLRIWWSNCGFPTEKNDINLFKHSQKFNDILTGMWSPLIRYGVKLKGFNLFLLLVCVMGFMVGLDT